MKLWPFFRSIEVCARRTTKLGTVMPFPIETEADLSTDETSGAISSEISPSASTVGVNSSPTPNFLYSTVIWPSSPDTGIGTSPPARKLALCPERAIRFGSASRRATPRSSSALMATSIVQPLVRRAPMI